MHLGFKLALTSTTALDNYGVRGYSPGLVFDFENDYYRTASTNDFSTAITYTGASNKTMVDSDGLLKWAPHNLLPYSEDFTDASWVASEATITSDDAVAPDGNTTADKLAASTTDTASHQITFTTAVSNGVAYTTSAFMKAGEYAFGFLQHNFAGGGYAQFNLSNGTIDTEVATNADIQDVGNGWYRCSITDTSFEDRVNAGFRIRVFESSGLVSFSGDGTSGIYVWGAHLYRSDLGGMVNNPDRSDSYVPTTSAAVYLPRRGHHVYNGSAWVNEGLLVESEARTNLVTYSEDFTDASWTKTNTAITSSTALSPDGTANANRIQSDNATGGYIAGTTVTSLVSGTTYTGSIYVKASELSFALVVLSNTAFGTNALEVNLANGSSSVGTGSFDSTNVIDEGNGWYRVSVTKTAVANGSGGLLVYLSNDGLWVNRGDAITIGDGILGYGAQLEEGSTPSSYIPTNGSTATRAAETLTVPSAQLPWPTPNVIGPELVTNGTFDTGDLTGWTDASEGGGTAAVVSGAVQLVTPTQSSEEGRIYQTITCVIGKTYLLSVDTDSNILAQVGTTQGGAQLLDLAPSGPITEVFTATATTLYLDIRRFVAGTANVDNISVREIDPLAVSIQMDGRVTYADEDTFSQHNFLSWTLDNSNRINVSLTTSSAFIGRVDFHTRENAVSYYATSTYLSPGILVPYNLASRHGSTFINGAVDGTALTANTTPTALPDLSSTDLDLASDYMGTVKQFRVWSVDLGDDGIEEAST